MPRFVRDDGPRSARLVLIGEAPGGHEDVRGIPFVGPAGQTIARWWHSVDLTRRDFYITNVYPYQPPNNRLAAIPKSEIADWTVKLHDRLAALDDPWLIVPTGNTALRALTGKVGIMKHRGSIYEYLDRNGRRIKVIPTIHPAATFQTPYHAKRCVRDWQRIAGDVDFRELRLPVREHFIRPSLTDVEDFVTDVEAQIMLPPGPDTVVGNILADPPFDLNEPEYDNPLRIEDRVKKVDDGAGGLVEQSVKFPVWFEPTWMGGTPMCGALDKGAEVVQHWVSEHAKGFPPIVIPA